MNDAEVERALLLEVLETARAGNAFPTVADMHFSHKGHRPLLDHLVERGLLRTSFNRYILTIEGLRACGSDEARQEIEACNALLPRLQEAYRQRPGEMATAGLLAQQVGLSEQEVARSLTFLWTEPGFPISSTSAAVTGFVQQVLVTEQIFDEEAIPWQFDQGDAGEIDSSSLRLTQIRVSGYRPFLDFSADLGDITVIIGSNASGKSSLFDFLGFLSFAATEPLPAWLDPFSQGKQLFHLGNPERISFALDVSLGTLPLRYEVEIEGPLGSPKIARERLSSVVPSPFAYLDFRGGKGRVRDRADRSQRRPPWELKPNELALRRALDPTLRTASALRGYLVQWGHFPGFDVAPGADVRRPVAIEPSPVLSADGSNLSAVLFWMMTEHREVWDELETHLRSCIKGFSSLSVKSRGGKGTVIGVWQEEGVQGEQTLADLSDGTLHLLCWLTLALSPSIPPLVLIDEPETGLHPRVLPTLAGALKLASSRAQLIVTTHSPYLLSQFSLDEIAVMRKEEGRAVFVRPGTSEILRREVDEIGGEALARLFISEELEVLP